MAAAAASLESANKVWQRVNIALAGASPCAQRQFRALKEWLSTQKGNPDLQFLPFVNTSIDDATGQALVGSAVRIVGIYGKKAATATDVYLAIFDDTTDDAGGATDGRIVLPFLEASEEQVFISPAGVSMAAGVVAKAYTDYDGTTDSTDTDCPSGFVIVKAA